MQFLSENRRWVLIGGAILLIPTLVVGYWLISPLFRDDEVDEDLPANIVFVTPNPDEAAEFPRVTGAEVEEGTSFGDVNATMERAEGADDMVMDDTMPEDMEMATTMPHDAIDADQITAMETHRLTFRDGDSFHQGSGTAVIYALSNGEHLLRFEDFNVTNGPDLHVYLVPRANRENVSIDGYTDLGSLKGNVGNQNYTIPMGVEVPNEVSVVIWCEPFRVLFSVAAVG